MEDRDRGDQGQDQVFVSKNQPALFLNGEIITLREGREYVLGRERASCDVVIDFTGVSRRHAMVFSNGGRYFIKDLQSMNGTYVNKERIKSSMGLLPGDEIIIPPAKLLFVLQDRGQIVTPINHLVQPTAATSNWKKSHFSGFLHTLRLPDLIQLLNSTLQTGVLTVQDMENNAAHIFFSSGEIVSARFKNKAMEEAVYAVLGITDGSFEFRQESITVPPNPIQTRTMTLLLEGVRRMDEAS